MCGFSDPRVASLPAWSWPSRHDRLNLDAAQRRRSRFAQGRDSSASSQTGSSSARNVNMLRRVCPRYAWITMTFSVCWKSSGPTRLRCARCHAWWIHR